MSTYVHADMCTCRHMYIYIYTPVAAPALHRASDTAAPDLSRQGGGESENKKSKHKKKKTQLAAHIREKCYIVRK